MIRRDSGRLLVEGAVTMQTVAGLAQAAEEHWKAGIEAVDFAGVTEVDSSAVALALEWQRQAARHNLALTLNNVPDAMLNLARLYGVAELMQLPAS